MCIGLAVACSQQAEPEQESGEEAASDEDDDDDDEKPEDAGQRRRDASQAAGDAASGRARDAATSRSEPDAGLNRDGRRDSGVPSSPGLPSTPGDAGARADAAASGGPATDGSLGDDELEMLRQLCVDTINMYRSTVGVASLTREPAQEACSDEGAKSDGDTGRAHGSAGKCGGLGGQDTCPGWGVGGFSGNATVSAALTKCLAQMWAEGEPPVSRQECERDYEGCFLKYGHYLNMSDTRYKKAACGFYKMANGSWWMNQNFGF